jgi:hypothetical protein
VGVHGRLDFPSPAPMASSPGYGEPSALTPSLQRYAGSRCFFLERRKRNTREISNVFGERDTDHEPDLSSFLAISCICTDRHALDRCGPRSLWRGRDWWKKQCWFRGLKIRGGIRVLKQRLRNYQGPPLTPKIQAIRNELEDDFEETNWGEVLELWDTGDVAKKAQAWPKRLLYESFPVEDPGRKSPLVFSVDRKFPFRIYWLHHFQEVAEDLGFYCKIQKLDVVQLPPNITGSPVVDQVVLGPSEEIVHEKAAELLKQNDEANDERSKAFDQYKAQRTERYHQKWNEAVRKDANQTGAWDVTGHWAICIPSIEEKFSSQAKHNSVDDALCKMHLVVDSQNRTWRMTGRFDFLVFFGVMRFLNLDASAKPQFKGPIEDPAGEGASSSEDDTELWDSADASSPASDEEVSPLCDCHAYPDAYPPYIATWSDYGSEHGSDHHPEHDLAGLVDDEDCSCSECDPTSDKESNCTSDEDLNCTFEDLDDFTADDFDPSDMDDDAASEDSAISSTLSNHYVGDGQTAAGNGQVAASADMEGDEPPPAEDSIPAEYQIPAHQLPSKQNNHFSYRWQGMSSAHLMGVFQNQSPCSLWFLSPHACKGIFTCGETNYMPFYGYKIPKDEPRGKKRERDEDDDDEGGRPAKTSQGVSAHEVNAGDPVHGN